MGLVKLTPEQVMDHWDGLRDAIASSLPPQAVDNPRSLLIVQQNLLTENMQCWVWLENTEPLVVLTTQAVVDDATESKYLLLFTITVLSYVTRAMWEEGLRSLDLYCQGNGYSKIIAYSSNAEILSIASKLGFDISWRVLSWKVSS